MNLKKRISKLELSIQATAVHHPMLFPTSDGQLEYFDMSFSDGGPGEPLDGAEEYATAVRLLMGLGMDGPGGLRALAARLQRGTVTPEDTTFLSQFPTVRGQTPLSIARTIIEIYDK